MCEIFYKKICHVNLSDNRLQILKLVKGGKTLKFTLSLPGVSKGVVLREGTTDPASVDFKAGQAEPKPTTGVSFTLARWLYVPMGSSNF